MSAVCTEGMFWCAFELVFGVGFALICLLILLAMTGIFDRPCEDPTPRRRRKP